MGLVGVRSIAGEGMNLTQMHRMVREAMLRGRVDDRGMTEPFSASEQRALRAFDKRLKAVGGHVAQLTPPVDGSLEWVKLPLHTAD
jgi:hypothetical protein